MDGFCLLKKKADKSVITDGFTIPVEYHDLFFKELGFTLAHGESRNITVLVDGCEYQAKLTNTNFDRGRFEHKDILQIRYSPNSLLVQRFREAFAVTCASVARFYETREGRKRYKPSDTDCEYLALYSTPVPGTILADCITEKEYVSEAEDIRHYDEVTLENTLDSAAHIEVKTGTQKVRHLTRAIGENLKLVYEYRCQICGQKIGDRYGSNLIHAHHIEYFVKSLNNDASNILIVCPNHHGIIHDRNPEFDRRKLLYRYPNGFEEGLALNRHIKPAEK